MCGLVLKLYMMSNETELIISIHRLEQLDCMKKCFIFRIRKGNEQIKEFVENRQN